MEVLSSGAWTRVGLRPPHSVPAQPRAAGSRNQSGAVKALGLAGLAVEIIEGRVGGGEIGQLEPVGEVGAGLDRVMARVAADLKLEAAIGQPGNRVNMEFERKQNGQGGVTAGDGAGHIGGGRGNRGSSGFRDTVS